jgi:hypothetical protein
VLLSIFRLKTFLNLKGGMEPIKPFYKRQASLCSPPFKFETNQTPNTITEIRLHAISIRIHRTKNSFLADSICSKLLILRCRKVCLPYTGAGSHGSQITRIYGRGRARKGLTMCLLSQPGSTGSSPARAPATSAPSVFGIWWEQTAAGLRQPSLFPHCAFGPADCRALGVIAHHVNRPDKILGARAKDVAGNLLLCSRHFGLPGE